MLSNQQFERTRQLALSLAGIELVERIVNCWTAAAGGLDYMTAADSMCG